MDSKFKQNKQGVLNKYTVVGMLIFFVVAFLINVLLLQSLSFMIGLLIGSSIGFLKFYFMSGFLSVLVMKPEAVNLHKSGIVKYILSIATVIIILAAAAIYDLFLFAGVSAGILAMPVIITISALKQRY
ncbi:MAG TPA: hypothetical protein GXX49_05115 [Clostridiaceae bacterium]|jgi:hypothetical protein|nr:hypothetical protein [Clostridiaceae bacterium]